MSFVHDFTYVDLPVQDVRERLLEGMVEWLELAAAEGYLHGEHLMARIGPSTSLPFASKQVVLEPSVPYARDEVLVVPLLWRASGPRAMFPVMEADLEVAPMGPDRTEVSLLGRYTPPLGVAGEALDRMLLHRVAEATVRTVLTRLVELLSQPAPTGNGA